MRSSDGGGGVAPRASAPRDTDVIDVRELLEREAAAGGGPRRGRVGLAERPSRARAAQRASRDATIMPAASNGAGAPPEQRTPSDHDDAGSAAASSSEIDVRELLAAPQGSPAGAPRHRKRRRSGGDRRRWGRLLVAVLLVALAGWGAAVYLTVNGARTELRAARDALAAGRDAMVAAEVEESAAAFAAASAHAADAGSRLRAPVLEPLRLAPAAVRNLDAAQGLAGAAGTIAAAGQAALAALPDGLADLAPRDGAVPVDRLAALAPGLREAADLLADATSQLDGIAVEGTVPEIADARAGALDLLDGAAEQASLVATLTEELPAFFGADGPRRYFVGASNPAEARGTGGFIGAFSILEVDGGRLEFSPVRPVQDLDNLPVGSIPPVHPSIAERYDRYGGTGFWLNLNMTPDFPSAATAYERLYEEVTGEAVDGMIVVDPFAFQELLEVAGPVTIAPAGEVEADEIVEFTANSAYGVITDPEVRKGLVGQVATAAFSGFLAEAGPDTAPAVLSALADMAARGSLLVHAVDPGAQAAMERAGVAGTFGGEPGDFLAVVTNNATGTKVDYYQHRTLSYDVTLRDDGTAVGALVAEIDNTAPVDGEPAYVIGVDTQQLDPGENLSLVSAYCASRCEVLETPDVGWDDFRTEEQAELGHPVVSTWLSVPAGQTRELLWAFQTPDAAERRGEELVYRLSYDHQTTVQPTDLAVTVTAPEGYEPVAWPEGATRQGATVTWERDVIGDASVEITFRSAQ